MEITLTRDEIGAGEILRGVVRGVEPDPNARGLRVELVHDAKHLRAHSGARVETEVTGPPGEAWPFDLAVPGDAPPTFEGRCYVSAWRVVATLDLPGQPDIHAECPVTLKPGPRSLRGAAREPAAAEYTGYRRFRRFLAVFTAVDLVVLGIVWTAVGNPPWAVLGAFLAPAVASLAMLALLAVRRAPVEFLEISVRRRGWRFGEPVAAVVTCEAQPNRLTALTVTLKSEEVWVTTTGKGAYTHRETCFEDSRRLSGAELEGARRGPRRWEWGVSIPLPEAGFPSHERDVQWSVEVKAAVPHRLDPVARLPLDVGGRVPPGEESA